MSGKIKRIHILILAISFILVCTMLTNILLSYAYANRQYALTADLADEFIAAYPEDEQKIMNAIKSSDPSAPENKPSILDKYGFDVGRFWSPYKSIAIFSGICCVLLLALLLMGSVYLQKSRINKRIQAMTQYLARANSGKTVTLLPSVEDEFSVLEDEIQKSVAEMKTAAETAAIEKQNYAESLAHIAHQIKTPVTSLDLSLQLAEDKIPPKTAVGIERQVDKIRQLTDALLTISRIDAGAVELKRESVDVYTLLTLSTEALEDQIEAKEIEMYVPNHPEVSFKGDLNWSTEVFINIIKNCIEHTPEGGKIDLDYRNNPLYTEIIITDNGSGFDKVEMPYIFNKFYRGKQRTASGAGIGLSMAKSIIEMQNGFITAKNAKKGGACFIIRFYCH